MKVARMVLKFVALGLMVAAAICSVIAYWDKLADFSCCAKDKLQAKSRRHVEYADYEE